MDFDFPKIMSAKTDEELFAVIAEPEKYQAPALDAAKAELRLRNVSDAALEQMNKAHSAEREIAGKKATEPLELRYYLLFAVAPFALLFVSGYFKGEGYDRKSKQAAAFVGYVWLAILVLVLLANVF